MSDINKTLEARGVNYGDYPTNAKISQTLKDFFRSCKGWDNLDFHQKETLDMIASKIARALNGNPRHIDNFHDISGYATLSEIEMKKEANKNIM